MIEEYNNSIVAKELARGQKGSQLVDMTIDSEVGYVIRFHQQQSFQLPVTSFFSKKDTSLEKLMLWITCENKPLSTTSDLFSDFLYDLNKSWKQPSYSTIKKVQHTVATKMRDSVINQLFNQEVCVIIDEMTNSVGSYLNFLVACY